MLQQSLENILTRYAQYRRTEQFGGNNEIVRAFRDVEGELSRLESIRNRPHLRVKYSVGQGNWARVPWIAFLDDRETSSTQKGIYCVYLFREDMSGVYITFNQGVTELINQQGRHAVHRELRSRAETIQQYCTDLQSNGFNFGNGIDLRAAPALSANNSETVTLNNLM